MRRSTQSDVAAFQAAVAGLPAPGAPAALPGRRHGRYTTATVGGVTLHLYDDEITFEMETFDATAHGEYWKTKVAGDQMWRGRFRGYFVTSDGPYLRRASASGDPLPVMVTVYSSATAIPANIIWQGEAFIVRANFSAPMAMVDQEMELESTGEPLQGLGA